MNMYLQWLAPLCPTILPYSTLVRKRGRTLTLGMDHPEDESSEGSGRETPGNLAATTDQDPVCSRVKPSLVASGSTRESAEWSGTRWREQHPVLTPHLPWNVVVTTWPHPPDNLLPGLKSVGQSHLRDVHLPVLENRGKQLAISAVRPLRTFCDNTSAQSSDKNAP